MSGSEVPPFRLHFVTMNRDFFVSDFHPFSRLLGPVRSTESSRVGTTRSGWTRVPPVFGDYTAKSAAVIVEVAQQGAAQNLDFRFGLQARKHVITGIGQGIWDNGVARWTPWASEGGGSSVPATAHALPGELGPGPEGYRISIQGRPWPQRNDQILLDFRLGLGAHFSFADPALPVPHSPRVIAEANEESHDWLIRDLASSHGGGVAVSARYTNTIQGLSIDLDTYFE
jgi:hypothetical protein